VRGFWVVLAKECRDNIRDRRTILASLSLALLGPVLIVALMAFVLNTTLGEARESFRIAVVGSEHAPALMAHLEMHGVELESADLPDPRQAVIDGTEGLVLVIGADYPERLRGGEANTVALIYDSSQAGAARRNFMTARQMIMGYGHKLGVLRLQLRGVDPAVLSPIHVAEMDTASPAARALSILGMLPYLLVLVVFMGGFYLAIDATAGEREHGSLEPLLVQPVSRAALVLGKVAAASVFSAMAVILFLISLTLSLPFVPLHKIGMSLQIGAVTAVKLFAISLPLMVLGAALLTVVASFAKSYKEAQTYLTLVILVPTLPLIVTQLLDIRPSAALMVVPSLSQATLTTSYIKGDAVPWSHLIISLGATSLVAALLAWLAIALYKRERLLL
jgi:sodium transport system permease protein